MHFSANANCRLVFCLLRNYVENPHCWSRVAAPSLLAGFRCFWLTAHDLQRTANSNFFPARASHNHGARTTQQQHNSNKSSNNRPTCAARAPPMPRPRPLHASQRLALLRIYEDQALDGVGGSIGLLLPCRTVDLPGQGVDTGVTTLLGLRRNKYLVTFCRRRATKSSETASPWVFTGIMALTGLHDSLTDRVQTRCLLSVLSNMKSRQTMTHSSLVAGGNGHRKPIGIAFPPIV